MVYGLPVGVPEPVEPVELALAEPVEPAVVADPAAVVAVLAWLDELLHAARASERHAATLTTN
jgi:hypothetical protein